MASWNVPANAALLICFGLLEVLNFNKGCLAVARKKTHRTTCFVTDRAKNEFPSCAFNDTSKCGVQLCQPYETRCHAIYKDMNGKMTPWLMTCHSPGLELDRCSENVCVMDFVKHHELFSCCCNGDKCNGNLLFKVEPTHNTSKATTSLIVTKKDDDHMSETKLLCYTLVPIFGIILIIGFILHLLRRLKRLQQERELLLPLTIASPPSQQYPIELLQLLHQGHISCVQKARYQQEIVAVKILDPVMYQYWQNEKHIYEICSLNHENILRFLNAEKRIENDKVQYLIITECHNVGSLADYLRKCTLTLNELQNMLLSIVKGLHYLHAGDNSSGKPVIAHRDFKSCNILVRDNLTCCIADFGLALVIVNSSKTVMSQVGTNRYMAPEILQGSISFLQESFLYIDIYGLALVTWELLSRCKHRHITPGPYQPPYSEDVGPHPSVDDMLRCVVEKKKRPHLKDEWNDDPTLTSICETMVECWDNDAYARLTACCVLERLTQLRSDASSTHDQISRTTTAVET